MKSLAWSALSAVAASALAVSINLATDLDDAWWAWAAVALFTVVTAFVTYRLTTRTDVSEEPTLTPQHPVKPMERQGHVSNSITGDVTGKAVQAGRVDGDINL